MYVVNMNRPGYLPDWEGMEAVTLKEAAGIALDLLEGMPIDVSISENSDTLINIENGYAYTGPFPIEVQAGEYVLFIAREEC